MLKRIDWKAIFKGFAWLICLAGVVTLRSFITIKKHEVKCTSIKILIPGSDNFIEREEIDAILKQGQGELIGRNIEEINIHAIELSLKNNPYIAFAKVYTAMDGIIHIEVKQRQPVLRILNAGGQDYYIDANGLKMPMSSNFTADVVVATGNILEGFSGKVDTLLTPLARDLYQTALFIKKDTLWNAQIEQIYVNENTDIELIPRVGNQRIILGNADSLDTKMNNLLAFYKQAMPLVGWNAYKTINLKYVNQIVCEKTDSLSNKKENVMPDSVKVSPIDTAVQTTINDEIKKAMAEDDANKPKPVANKINEPKKTVTKEATIKTQANTTVTTNNKSVVVPQKDKQKPVVTTKDKTDTKKTL